MSKYKIFAIAAAIYSLGIMGCSKNQAEEIKPTVPATPGSPGVQVTYTGLIQSLLQTKCAGCHAPGKQAAAVWNFNGYNTVTANADRIKNAVLVQKTMPLGGSLSAAELQSLKDWFDQGMPQ